MMCWVVSISYSAIRRPLSCTPAGVARDGLACGERHSLFARPAPLQPLAIISRAGKVIHYTARQPERKRALFGPHLPFLGRTAAEIKRDQGRTIGRLPVGQLLEPQSGDNAGAGDPVVGRQLSARWGDLGGVDREPRSG